MSGFQEATPFSFEKKFEKLIGDKFKELTGAI